MAIASKPLSPARARVIVVGTFGPTEWQTAEDAFNRRGYQLEVRATGEDLGTLAATIDSVILLQSAIRRNAVASLLAKYGSALLDTDCRIYVRSPDPGTDQSTPLIIQALEESQLPAGYTDAGYTSLVNASHLPRVQICPHATSWEEFAQLVAAHPAGPPPSNDVELVGPPLSSSAALLVRRAFHDCSRVELVAMPDGLSGVTAYRAFAALQEGTLGPSPYQYFVKIGRRDKVIAEVENYRGKALAYVPFHLGPRLIESRCGLGSRDGILVGDLVSDCLTLRECAKYAGVAAIASLFNRTLKAWQDTSYVERATPLATLLAPRLLPEMPAERFQIAQRFGARRTYAELGVALQQRARDEDVRLGAIHGDLHATNILVRGFDAVLIDFESQDNAQPLLFDPASLEGGLLVDGFCADPRSVEEILQSIRPLYANDLLGWQAPRDAATQSDWYYDCVRQIRMHARQLECAPGQYATTLACTLLKKAANPAPALVTDPGKKNQMRAAAYCLAEFILDRALP